MYYTAISQYRYEYFVKWLKEHEERFSDLCDKKLTTVRHHSDFIKQTHGTKWFETKLETCLDKVIVNTSFGNSSFEPQDKLWRVCRDTKMSNSQRYYWSGERSSML